MKRLNVVLDRDEVELLVMSLQENINRNNTLILKDDKYEDWCNKNSEWVKEVLNKIELGLVDIE